MNQNLIKNDSPASDSAKKSKEFRRNPSPDSDCFKALTVVQDLSWGSLFPLLKVYIKFGPFSIYYQRASRGGLKLGSLLYYFGLAVSYPFKIKDVYYYDTPHVIYWNTQHQVHTACRNKLVRIEALIKKHFPESTAYMRKLLATNVSQSWQNWLLEVILLQSMAKQLGKQEKISIDRVVLVSRYASLLRILNLDTKTNNAALVWPQPNQNRAILYPLATVVFSLLEILQEIFRSFSSKTNDVSKSSNPFRIGVAAAWGTEGMGKSEKDDLYWWRASSIASDRLVYMFERENIQPTRDRVRQVKNLGIESVALNPKFPGDYPGLLTKNKQNQSILTAIQNFCFLSKLTCKTLIADKFSRAVLALVSWQFYFGRKLANIYEALNLKGVFHFEEASVDIISLASVMSDSMRIGTHWASHTGINQTSARSHQVYFLWGNHDAKFAVESGAMSRCLLISGCFLSDHSNKGEHQEARKAADEMRERGVRYILTLFDSSSPCPEFYRFFLQWLVEDPCLGLMIKSKAKSWEELCKDGLNGLVDRANQTHRIHVVDPMSSPVDAALTSDFSVGTLSISALILAALHGSRILFLDYERVDQGPQKPYCILHSLGSNRCVFYEPDLLRRAITKNFKNPEAYPSLGDATPILDQLDPFRDGKASQRIGEFVEWYLEAVDGGLNVDDAVRSATDKYAEKWGQDKVVRSL
jgi:hypothetical protein